MKYTILTTLLFFISAALYAQNEYGVSEQYPYGRLNPEAPKETADFHPLIGTCKCRSTMRNPDGSWGETQDMTWIFKYIMNGTAVQDETWKEDGSHAGSIRQFIADSSKWYVHYYSNRLPSTKLPAWEGERKGDSIILYKEQKAPNGMEGYYRIAFRDISAEGFNWLGEWVDPNEKIHYPTWKIACIRQETDE